MLVSCACVFDLVCYYFVLSKPESHICMYESTSLNFQQRITMPGVVTGTWCDKTALLVA